MAKLSRLGQYKLVRKLGQGGMGAVFEALQEGLDRRVAVKILPARSMGDPSFVERFKREAKAAARLNHPNIVTIYEIGEDQGYHFFSMELVDGLSLHQRLKEEGQLGVAEALGLMIQAIQGLAHAWEQSIIHRDIKPDNLMLTKAGVLKITDLGLAKFRQEMGTMTQTGASMGTPYYMSPEQGSNAKEVDLRADIYSLGATFYHVVTGRVPFEGSSPIEVAIKVATAPLRPVREWNQDVPGPVAAVIEQMLARDPNGRYQSGNDLLRALRHIARADASATPGTGFGADLAGLQGIAHQPEPATNDDTQADTAADDMVVQVQRVLISRAAAAEEARKVEAQARKLIYAPPFDYAAAIKLLESVPEPLRDQQLLESAKQRRDQVPQLETEIRERVQRGDLDWLVFKVEALLSLQPSRADMKRLRDSLPVTPKMLTNSIGMKLALIPPSTFLMGAADGDADATDNEKPQHRVTITKPFYMGIYPVTQREYEAVMGVNPARFKESNGGGPDHPVESVSWDDAIQFCAKLSGLPAERTGVRKYRLPTEAEWEYACRAGTTTPFYFGESLSITQANFAESKLNGTTKVGLYAPNAFGLHDMHGDVFERCADWYHETYYRTGPEQDPPGPPAGSYRVYRGGSWSIAAGYCRSANRCRVVPSDRSISLGFRVAASPSGK